jgi:hypothetical protein
MAPNALTDISEHSPEEVCNSSGGRLVGGYPKPDECRRYDAFWDQSGGHSNLLKQEMRVAI